VSEAANKASKNLAFKPSRRELAAFGAVAAIGSAAAAPLSAATVSTKTHSLSVKNDGNLFRPETGEHPGLVMFASVAASHSANAAVAHQLASQGWAVMLVNALDYTDTVRVNRDAKAHAKWLLAQPGVSKPKKSAAANSISTNGFVLRSFSAAHPTLSLASRAERRAANVSSTLFAVPATDLAQSKDRLNSLHSAARALHRYAA
jgi:hypothetical protein